MWWLDSKPFMVFHQSMARLMSLRYIFRNHKWLSLETTPLSNLKCTTCSSKLLLIKWKKIPDLFVGMPSSMNDAWILQISNLYDKDMDGDLFRMVQGEKKFKLYILGDKGYLLVPWVMVCHKQVSNACHVIL